MKHKTGSPISKLRSLAMENGKPMSQIAFAKFIGMPSGTLARVEAGTVELPWDAAERIEAACGVDADRLYDGELRALDGSPYTAQTWHQRRNWEFSDEQMEGLYAELQLRIMLLLGALGKKRAAYGGARLRQMLEAVREESGVAAAEIELAARANAKVFVEELTPAQLMKLEDVPANVVAKLKKLPPKKKLRLTAQEYATWPPYRMEKSTAAWFYAVRELYQLELPGGEIEGWAVTRAGGYGLGKRFAGMERGLWGTTPKLSDVESFLPSAPRRG